MTTDTLNPISESRPKASSIDAIRERLRPHDCVDIINEIESTLRDEWSNLGKNQVDGLKLLADIEFRKLAKILPDLKAMDHGIGETASKVNFVINLDSVKRPADDTSDKKQVTL